MFDAIGGAVVVLVIWLLKGEPARKKAVKKFKDLGYSVRTVKIETPEHCSGKWFAFYLRSVR